MRFVIVAIAVATPLLSVIGCAGDDAEAEDQSGAESEIKAGKVCKTKIDNTTTGQVRSTTTNSGMSCFTTATGSKKAGCVGADAVATIAKSGVQNGRVQITASSSCALDEGPEKGDSITCWAPVSYLCPEGAAGSEGMLGGNATCTFEKEDVPVGECRSNTTSGEMICKNSIGERPRMVPKQSSDECKKTASEVKAAAKTETAATCKGQSGQPVEGWDQSEVVDWTVCGKEAADGTMSIDTELPWVKDCVARGGKPNYQDNYVKDTCQCLCP